MNTFMLHTFEQSGANMHYMNSDIFRPDPTKKW